jgi:hypothetical protein
MTMVTQEKGQTSFLLAVGASGGQSADGSSSRDAKANANAGVAVRCLPWLRRVGSERH